MARPERFELPTAWFIVLSPNLTNYLIYLTIMAIDSPPRSMKNAVNQLFLTG